MNKQQIWTAFNRMQKVCMSKSSLITKKQFFDEPELEQREYYNWMRQQVGPFTQAPYWE